MVSRRTFIKMATQTAGASLFVAASPLAPPDSPLKKNDTQKALAYLPASTLLSLFQKHELSPVDVLEAQITQIQSLNKKINCITYQHFDEARIAARDSEKRYQNGTQRPLEGITIAVKDEYAVKQWVTTMGSLLLKDAPPDKNDHPVIERLRQAGAIFHIQTTVPEFYSWITTTTRLWGSTRNPWNTEYSPGGSSGGSGAALAAGFTTLALGSDMGGSIRIPSALCGLYGFKPPFGRIPTSEVAYESEGPMARTFDDLNLFTRAMVGPHPLIHSSIRPKLDFPAHYPTIKKWRIAYDYGEGLTPLTPSTRNAFNHAIELLKNLGASLEKVDIGFSTNDISIFMAGLFSTSMGGMLIDAQKSPEKLTPYLRFILEQVKGKTGPQAMIAAENLLSKYQLVVQQKVFTQGFQALIMPTLGTSLLPADHGLKPESDSVNIHGKIIKGPNFVLTWPWNLLGRYPVVSVPLGIGEKNMPMGMQIIANTFDDLGAFQVASAYAHTAVPIFNKKNFPDL